MWQDSAAVSSMLTNGDAVPSLRVGILLDGTDMPAWRAETIRRIARTDGVEIVVLVQPHRVASPQPKRRDLGGLLWRAYLRNLTNMKRSRSSWVMRPDSIATEMAGVPRIAARPLPVGRFRERLSDESIAELRRYRPDVLLRFAFGILTGEVLTLPTYGMWSFHFGDEERYRGGPAAFWEVYEATDTVGGILQRLTERLDAGVVLRKGLVSVSQTSYQQTWDATHEQALDWPAEV
ncbi:MAG TPA: hypothetical protein DGG94_23430, partial [Micromonosporaceae bacterium]|nr:hypothetical protein [Micromonosporaceae bacterium]